jgi:hypothetical protein
MTKNLKKFAAKNFFSLFFSNFSIYLSPGLHRGLPSYRRSLQPSKEKIQYFKT